VLNKKDQFERAGKKIYNRKNPVNNQIQPACKIPMLVVPGPLKLTLIV